MHGGSQAPEELNAEIRVTRGGIISPGKNINKKPSLNRPQGHEAVT